MKDRKIGEDCAVHLTKQEGQIGSARLPTVNLV